MQKRGILMKHLEVVAAILEYDGKKAFRAASVAWAENNVDKLLKIDNGQCMERGQGKFDYVGRKNRAFQTAPKEPKPVPRVSWWQTIEIPGCNTANQRYRNTATKPRERELREEMDVHVSVKESDLYMTVHHDYPDFSMTMYAFYCHLDKPDFVRKEHVDAKWMAPEDMPTLDWAPADVPIMKKLSGK